MIPNDTLKTIQDTAVEASKNRICTPKPEPEHVYFIVDAQGELQKQHAAPPPARHQATDIESVVNIAKDADDKQVQTLWCSINGVVAVLSNDRRERAELKLTLSVPFRTLSVWNDVGVGGAALDHVSCYTHFRTVFRDCLSAHGTVREDIKRVDVKKAQEAASSVSRTGVSMSKSLVAEASGADKLPEVLTFDVPVFAEACAPIKAKVRVAFDLDPQQERFRFIVLPGEIERAVSEAESWLMAQVTQHLAAMEIKTYLGKP